ncbi:3' terminal RNA ribose 2'-O-methyltransferase Hen1 [Cellulomonas taurus]|uniref:3' terminal RNA ribose 2'-O-methyltransferase Hen1 n=1 Tax=Cellulomonas taurus TaxID=2729175 RepID=UPI00145F73EB|nr:3' terminal RNA ribose 2'-O-methyltransferase Hen1 [Cellulomonas taurus]
MLLTLASTTPDATDLGYLLHKHPARAQSFDLSVGTAHVFYPEATPTRCEVALLLEVDPIALVRGHSGISLSEYVNDRPYAASSMLAVALGRVFRTAIAGRCPARPELPERELDLDVHVPSAPCRGGAAAAKRLFEPLGWQVSAIPIPLDPAMPEWGDSHYVDLRMSGRMRVADALSHLYVLLPALDSAKHYWVGEDEVDKLLRAGERWLAGHPHRAEIARCYLANRSSLADSALDRITESDGADADITDVGEPEPDRPLIPSLARHRLDAVLAVVAESSARSVVDLGCGEGRLLSQLLDDPRYDRLLGVDVAPRELSRAARRLHLDTLPEARRRRIDLIQSSVTYRDDRLTGFDTGVLMEVIEHVDPPRLGAFERAVFEHARPSTLIVTTPNVEHNVRYPSLTAGHVRHHDHRFEWTRAEFQDWAHAVADRQGYTVDFRPIGPDDPEVGPATQMAVFSRSQGATA